MPPNASKPLIGRNSGDTATGPLSNHSRVLRSSSMKSSHRYIRSAMIATRNPLSSVTRNQKASAPTLENFGSTLG